MLETLHYVLFLCSERMYFVELFWSEVVNICWNREVIQNYEDRVTKISQLLTQKKYLEKFNPKWSLVGENHNVRRPVDDISNSLEF